MIEVTSDSPSKEPAKETTPSETTKPKKAPTTKK